MVILCLYLVGLFGEGPADRRERLRHLLAQIGADAIRKEKVEAIAEKKKKDEVWYNKAIKHDSSVKLTDETRNKTTVRTPSFRNCIFRNITFLKHHKKNMTMSSFCNS